jgi:transketolase
MRNAFADELNKIARENNSIYLLYGDIGNKLFDGFKSNNPERYSNAGVAEASMVGIASGLAKLGFRPVVYTINSFLSLKTIEQIKLDICYSNLPVVMVGTGGGLSYSELGTTHHSLEDFALLSAIPNLQLLAPSDPIELRACLKWAIRSGKPTYIRIGKKGELNVHDSSPSVGNDYFGPFTTTFSHNAKHVLVSVGTISSEVSKACQKLNNLGLAVDHVVFPQLRPFNHQAGLEITEKYSKIYIVEEHTEIGGLMTQFLHAFTKNNSKQISFYSFNTGDVFHRSLGSLEQGRESLGLSSQKIFERVKENF